MQARKGRQGSVLSIRISDEDRAAIMSLKKLIGGPRGLGPWIIWKARLSARGVDIVPLLSPIRNDSTPIADRVIWDLCGGTGAWSKPYKDAGYPVVNLTLPDCDVRMFRFEGFKPWGILAAPPCTEFSLAKNGQERDVLRGLSVVNGCMRVILQAQPQWWALENPHGLLSKYLGTPRFQFQPYTFGDPWTKRTCLWGNFNIPQPGPFVEPTQGVPGRYPRDRAITPAGFARAFFEANP
jgi:hypothetical protein